MRQSDKEEIDGKSRRTSPPRSTSTRSATRRAGCDEGARGFRDAWTNYVETTKGVFTLPANDVNGVTKIISDGAGDAAWEQVKTSLKAWDEANARTAATLVAETRASASSTKTTSIAAADRRLLVAWRSPAAHAQSRTRGQILALKAARHDDRPGRTRRAVAAGDLTVEVTPVTPALRSHRNDEIGDVAEAVGAIRDNTAPRSTPTTPCARSSRASIGRAVRQAPATVAAASQQMAATSEETGRASARSPPPSARSPRAPSAGPRVGSPARPSRRPALRDDHLRGRRGDRQAADEARAARRGRARRQRRQRAMREVARRRPRSARDPASSGRVRAISGIVVTITGDRRADQPAGAQRRHRGRARRRAGPGLRGRRRGGPQAGRGVPERRGPDRRADRGDPARDARVVGVVDDGTERTKRRRATVERAREAFEPSAPPSTT